MSYNRGTQTDTKVSLWRDYFIPNLMLADCWEAIDTHHSARVLPSTQPTQSNPGGAGPAHMWQMPLQPLIATTYGHSHLRQAVRAMIKTSLRSTLYLPPGPGSGQSSRPRNVFRTLAWSACLQLDRIFGSNLCIQGGCLPKWCSIQKLSLWLHQRNGSTPRPISTQFFPQGSRTATIPSMCSTPFCPSNALGGMWPCLAHPMNWNVVTAFLQICQSWWP